MARVLVVDDAPAVTESMKTALTHLGVAEEDILVAGKVSDALKIFHADEIDLLFLDVQLDHESSDQLAISMLKLYPKLRIVLITGLDRSDERVQRIISAGAYEYIQKPIRYGRLQEVMELIDSEAKGLRRVK